MAAPIHRAAGAARATADAGAASNASMERRVLLAGSIGQFVEFYDFALYGLSAVALSKLFFPSESPLAGLLATFATYGAAFFVRPLGGLFFGRLGDRVGRRQVLYLTLLIIGVTTAAIGLLPTHGSVGALAPVLLVTLRLVQGFSVGGEGAGAATFVYEHAPEKRRGFHVNICFSATALPSVFAALLILLLSTSMSDTAYMAWGWRIPFLLALPLTIVGLWIRSRTEESDAFKEAQLEMGEHPASMGATFRQNLTGIIQVIFVMGMAAMSFYCLSGFFVSFTETAANLSREESLGLNAFILAVDTLLLPLWGLVGDRVGRLAMLKAGSLALAVVTIPCFMLVTSGSLLQAVVGQLVFVAAVTCYGGGAYTFFVERFATTSRFTSGAVGYNIGYAVFGGTMPFIGTWLSSGSFPAMPGVYIAAFAAIVFIFLHAAKVPETSGNRS
jgi:MHS family proline/betaine transporter-like MFS transporter